MRKDVAILLHECMGYFFFTSFLLTTSSPTKIPFPLKLRMISREAVGEQGDSHIVRLRYSPASNPRSELPQTLFVDSLQFDSRRSGRGCLYVGGYVDENSVSESELEIEPLGGGIGGGGDRFDTRSITDADETEGGGVPGRDSNDGIGEERAREAPDRALVLDGGILNGKRDLAEIRILGGVLELDERKALHDESTEGSLHRDSVRFDRERNGFRESDGGGADVREGAARGVESTRQRPRRRSEHGRGGGAKPRREKSDGGRKMQIPFLVPRAKEE